MDPAPTLNPFLLFVRSVQKGRFTRSEFAIAYGGAWACVFVMTFAAGVAASLLGLSERARGFVVLGLVVLGLLVLVPISIGSVLRRLADSGNSGWLALFLLVPCVNVLFLGYLLFAPTTQKPSSATPAVILLVAAVAVVVALPFVVGIIAAIAIPSLLRARVSANESAVLGDIRTLQAAQAAYAIDSNAGYARDIDCLVKPAQEGCIPGYPRAQFLYDNFQGAGEVKSGYRRAYVPAAMRDGSISGYCFGARPLALNRTGTRSFAGDATGVLVAAPGDVECCDGARVDLGNCAALN